MPLLLITDRHGQGHFHILSARETAIRHVLRSGKVLHLGSCVKSIGTRLQLSIWLLVPLSVTPSSPLHSYYQFSDILRA